jgi:FlaG/FlaF family flagellin (archaellin)
MKTEGNTTRAPHGLRYGCARITAAARNREEDHGMKKRMAVLLMLALVFTLTAAAAQTYTSGNYYTIVYPDSLQMDDTSHTDESSENNQWLFTLSGDDYLIDAALTSVEEFANFSHYSATDAEKANYLSEVLSTFADSNPSLVDVVETADGIPFYIFSLEDSDGVYYYAETITNGISVNFCCYYYDATIPPDTMLLYNLESVLRSFTPVVEQTEDSAS